MLQGRNLNIQRKTALIISKTGYYRNIIEKDIDLSPFREKPSKRILLGLVLIIISYIIGWPAVGAFGILAIYLREPLYAVIGGPAIYIFSHIVFWTGLYLAGAKYVEIFFQWLTRKFVERQLGAESPGCDSMNTIDQKK